MTMPNEFTHDVFLSHSAKDKAMVRLFSLSASTGERAGVRCRSLLFPERLRQDGPFKFGPRTSGFGLRISPSPPARRRPTALF